MKGMGEAQLGESPLSRANRIQLNWGYVHRMEPTCPSLSLTYTHLAMCFIDAELT